MIPLFTSASEKDVEIFAACLRERLNSKFSFVIGQSKTLHLLAELNGFKNWQSFKIGLSRNIPQFVLDFFEQSNPELDQSDILDAEERDGVVYLAVRWSNNCIRGGVLFPRGENWWKFYWDIEEPIADDCPARILDKLSPTEDEGALRWRERCRIRAARDGEFDYQELPYRQLYYLAFAIEVDEKKVEYFVRSTDDVYEGFNRDGDCVTFSFADLGEGRQLSNIQFTTVPEFHYDLVSIQEFISGSRLANGLKLFSIGGKKPVDVLMEKCGRVVSWCGCGTGLREHYGLYADSGFLEAKT